MPSGLSHGSQPTLGHRLALHAGTKEWQSKSQLLSTTPHQRCTGQHPTLLLSLRETSPSLCIKAIACFRNGFSSDCCCPMKSSRASLLHAADEL